MVQDCISTQILVDGAMRPATDVQIPSGATVIYDVLRVMDGVPLFVEDHSARFFKSFDLSERKRPFEESWFEQSINQFIRQYGVVHGNIRCVYSISAANETQYLVYEIKHSYPTAEMYANGVACGTFVGERANPNVKQEAAVKTNAYKKIAETGVYEVLLVDNDHNVTEGSKSNTFFVKGNTIVTAMAQDVLCGITRLQIVSLIHSLRIPLEERKIHLSELSGFDAAFISGTSPKVLPIRSVESIEYKVDNPIVQKLSEAYNKSISNYIESYKKRKQ
ncbi:MAG: aminotransferase class IV family protein [Bacteroidales bacterium]|nr:aminotransferase class IV family protein [Bacteroidales bacterium]